MVFPLRFIIPALLWALIVSVHALPESEDSRFRTELLRYGNWRDFCRDHVKPVTVTKVKTTIITKTPQPVYTTITKSGTNIVVKWATTTSTKTSTITTTTTTTTTSTASVYAAKHKRSPLPTDCPNFFSGYSQSTIERVCKDLNARRTITKIVTTSQTTTLPTMRFTRFTTKSRTTTRTLTKISSATTKTTKTAVVTTVQTLKNPCFTQSPYWRDSRRFRSGVESYSLNPRSFEGSADTLTKCCTKCWMLAGGCAFWRSEYNRNRKNYQCYLYRKPEDKKIQICPVTYTGVARLRRNGNGDTVIGVGPCGKFSD